MEYQGLDYRGWLELLGRRLDELPVRSALCNAGHPDPEELANLVSDTGVARVITPEGMIVVFIDSMTGSTSAESPCLNELSLCVGPEGSYNGENPFPVESAWPYRQLSRQALREIVGAPSDISENPPRDTWQQAGHGQTLEFDAKTERLIKIRWVISR